MRGWLIRLQNDLRHGRIGGVGNRQVGTGRSQSLKEFASFVVKGNRRPATGCSSYFYVLPGNTPVPPRADGFHRGLLGGEARGVAFYFVGFRLAVADFFRGEDAFQESSPEAIDGGGDARNFCDINAGADDHGEGLLWAYSPLAYSPLAFGLWLLAISADLGSVS